MTGIHITRDYSAHKKSVLRPYDEYCGVEIFSFDPIYTRTYLAENNTLKKGENLKKTSWKSWTCYKSNDPNDDMDFEISYSCKVEGDYRIDIVYEQNNKIHKDNKYNTSASLMGEVKVYRGSKKVASTNEKFDGENNIIKRKNIFHHLNKGTHTIKMTIPHNCYMLGVIIRKVITYKGNNYFGENANKDQGEIMFTKASLSISDATKPSELSLTIAYDDAFECYDSPSGFYMDYRDEVNFYVKDNDGKIRRVFGGYISSILPNNDRTELSIHCADRLVDGQNKYILSEMQFDNGTKDNKTDEYSVTMTKNFKTYGNALKYLCNVHEVTLKSNISKNFLVECEKYSKGFKITYGKNKTIKKIKTSNGYATPSKNFITIRNKPRSNKKQTWTLYNAKDHGKQAPDITNYGYMHITYGMGSPKTDHQSKTTEKVDTSDTTAGVQKFNKCGVSEDGKYIMGIGRTNVDGDKTYPYTNLYKRIYKNKCPNCGQPKLRFDGGSANKCITTRAIGYKPSVVHEHEFTCLNCDCDFDVVRGKEKESTNRKMTPVTNAVKSSQAEFNQLVKGKMKAVPTTGAEVTPDQIFEAITKLAKKYKYRRGTSSSYSAMQKSGTGDCWAFSDLILHEFRRYNITSKIVEYNSGVSNNHRSVMYKDKNNKWVDFPYRKYNWNKMLNNTSNSSHGRVVDQHKGTNIGNIKTTGKTTSKKQTTTITTTKGYDISKPFQGYLKITYSHSPSFNAKKYKLYIKFTYDITVKNSINKGFKFYWVNNTTKKSTLDVNLVSFIRQVHSNPNEKVYLQSIQMIAPSRKPSKKDEDVDWYKYDKSTHDESSCKMNLYQIVFNANNTNIEPNGEDMKSCGKTVNSMLKQLVDSSGYLVDITYGKHRKDDRINFRVNNLTTPVYTATEGDYNNILAWNNISYTPISSLFNMSMQVYKQDGYYKYVDSRSPDSILKYNEQCVLQTSNEPLSDTEAYFNARMNDKFRADQTYSYTITVPNYPHIRLGELVKVIADAKKLNTIKELKSIKIDFDWSKIPRIQTQLGLDELSPDIQLKKNIRDLRRNAKKETTSFDGGAVPVNSADIFEWDR